jgi:DNA-binding GntR family transcriptional regulator
MTRTITVEKGDTLANALRRRIADKILHDEIEPGTRLDETGLAAEFGVSRTPVREALRQLAAAGLVTNQPHVGTVVQPIDQTRVVSLCEAAMELESLCARLAAIRMSVVDLGRLRQIHRACEAARAAGDASAFAAENRKFHSAVIAGTHNPHLADAVEFCRLRLAPYQKVQFDSPARQQATQDEHELIVAALERRNGEAAAAAMQAHLAAAAVAIDERLRLAGRY